jgi:hypothetical protein
VYLLDGNSVRQYKASVQHRLTDKLAGHTVGAVRRDQRRRVFAERRRLRDRAEHRTVLGGARRRGGSCRRRPESRGRRARNLRQDLQTPAALVANDSDKLALSVAQDLSVIGLTPFGADWKLLLALEQAHGTTPTTTDHQDESATANRLMGGVAVSF